MVAHTTEADKFSSDFPLAFQNVCALVKFTTDYRCKSIKLTAKGGENLTAEELRIAFDENGKPSLSVVSGTSSTVTLTGKDGEIIQAGTYYIAVLPGTLSGFDITFTNVNDDKTYTKTGSKAATLTRSKILNLGTISLRGTDIENLEGSGTTEDPYLIKDFDDLYTMQRWIANNKGLSSCYRQTADIVATGKKMNPIGNEYSLFSGTYDGNGHYIKGLVYWQTVKYDCVLGYYDSRYATYASALFGAVKNATICNLTIIDPVFDKDNNRVNLTMSPLVGVAFGSKDNWCKIKNCKVQGSSSFLNKTNKEAGNSPVLCYSFGGFVGDSQCNLEIEDCEYDMNFTIDIDAEQKAYNHVGGFVGVAQGINEDSSERLEDDGTVIIKHCRTKNVTLVLQDVGSGHSETSYFGGFIGRATDISFDNSVVFAIINCVNNMILQTGYRDEDVNYCDVHLGGFVGRSDCEGTSNNHPGCMNCINNGELIAYYNRNIYMGGIVGSSIKGLEYSTSIQFCVNAAYHNLRHYNKVYSGGITSIYATLFNCWDTKTYDVYEYWSEDPIDYDPTYWGSQADSGKKDVKEIVSYMNSEIEKYGLTPTLNTWVNRGTSSKVILDLDF